MANTFLISILSILLSTIGIISGFFLAYFKAVGMCWIWWTGMGLCVLVYTGATIYIDRVYQKLRASDVE